MPPSSNVSVISHSSMGTTRTVMNDRLAGLLIQPENHRCADCSDLRPSWASLIKPNASTPPESPTIGLFCCLFCSAAHKLLGDDICTVKSVKLDQWTDEEIRAMEMGGNLKANAIFEGGLFDDTEKPTPLVDAAVRERYVREKYLNLKYFVARAYNWVRIDDEAEDDSIVDDDEQTAVNTISAFSQSTNFTKHILPSIAEAPSRLSCLLMTPQLARPSLGTIPRQSSMPDMKYSMGANLTTPTSCKVSEALALKKIASPFREDNDFWESMNNSQWGDLTFDDSLHRKSGVDLANNIRRSSWNLVDEDRLPTCPENDKGEECNQRDGRRRRRGMPKKAVSERMISTSSKDLLPRIPATSKSESKKKLDRGALMTRQKCMSDRVLVSSRRKPGRNLSLGSSKRPKPKPSRNLSLGSPRRKSKQESPSQSPSNKADAKTLDLLDLLEEKNRDRKRVSTKPGRHQSEPFGHLKPLQLPPRQKSAPSTSLRKAQSLRNMNQSVTASRSRADRDVRISEATAADVAEKGKSRSLSPKSHRASKSAKVKKRTSSRNSRGHRQGEERDQSSLNRSSSLPRTSRHMEKKRQQILQRQANNSDSSGFSGSKGSKSSSRRSSSADAAKVKRKRNEGISATEHPPPPEGTPSTPGNRKVHKSRTPKTPLTRKSSSLKCPDSAPAKTKLEQSARTERSQKNRPRSLSVGRKNRLRRMNKANDEMAATEHSGNAAFQHPLFACPTNATTH